MISMGYAIVDSTGLVTNIIEWDGASDWAPPDGQQAVPLTNNGGISWHYTNGEFTPPFDAETVK